MENYLRHNTETLQRLYPQHYKDEIRSRGNAIVGERLNEWKDKVDNNGLEYIKKHTRDIMNRNRMATGEHRPGALIDLATSHVLTDPKVNHYRDFLKEHRDKKVKGSLSTKEAFDWAKKRFTGNHHAVVGFMDHIMGLHGNDKAKKRWQEYHLPKLTEQLLNFENTGKITPKQPIKETSNKPGLLVNQPMPKFE